MAIPRPHAWTRRAFAALVLALLAGVVALWLRWPDAQPLPAASAATETPSQSVEPKTARVPPAYLAWTPGGLTEGFRAQVRTIEAFSDTLVVAGDTIWLTSTRDPDGAVVDHPRPPFAFPIDAFSVNPIEFEPFVPAELSEDVIGALDAGQAVLGASSADLRRLGVGGTLVFDDRTVEVGAVVPDEVVGWSEMLVSRETGEPLGISTDRYLLALAEGELTQHELARLIEPLVPPDVPLRVSEPDGVPYVRVASAVNPPIVMKGVFGEFAATPEPGNPAFLTIEPAWLDQHIRTRAVPLLGRITCNDALFPALLGALREIEREGLGHLINTNSGCFAARTVARSPTAPPSQHAYGAAVDINAPRNAFGATPTMDERIVEIFRRWGFVWGGAFLVPDGMHFEYGSPPAG